MADPMTYNDPDRYVIVNPDNPKVVHQTWDAPLVDPETKQFITDENGKIKVIRCINFGTKGLTQAQVDSRIEVKNVDLVNRLENLTTTVNTFLTGEPDDNETLDRLSELVQYIDSHQDTIDALTTTYLTINDFNDFKETVVTTDYLDGKINEINLDLNTNYLTYDNITDDLGSLATDKAPTAKNLSNVATHVLQIARELLTARTNLQDVTNEVNLLKAAVITGGGSSGSGAGAIVVTIPVITGSNAVIGASSKFTVSAKSLLVGGKIEKFLVTLTGCESQTVTPNGEGVAEVYFRVPDDGSISAGQNLSMSVMATDNAGNNSTIVTKDIMANAKPVIIDPDVQDDPTQTEESATKPINSPNDIDSPETIYVSPENGISNVNDVKGNPIRIDVTVLPLPEDYATRGLNTKVVYMDRL